MNVEELKVLITAETKGLKKEIEKVKDSVQKLDRTVSSSTKSINQSFKNMFKGINFAAITAGFGLLSKSAIQYASDLQEVQNVVDVAFGAMANDINEWSKTTLKAFGLNELSSKRMAGRFMAMGNGMGIAAEKGLVMSKTLTQLSGDIASFYNVSVEEAETALQSIYTGETETLKRYGIVITEVNLQEYARRQGIQKSITQMTQLEKVMLRYNYIMEVTAQAQGDFARTSGSWANQVRLLKEQFQQLIGILGSGFIKALTPVVKALNQLLSMLISIANSIAATFGGKGIQQSTASVSSSLGDINQSVGDTSAGLNDANTSAKKLAKTLAGFDELNVLNTSSGSGSGGSSGGGGALGEMLNGDVKGYGAIVPTEEYEGASSKLTAYFQELKDIITKWTDKIPKLEIRFDKQAALEDLQNIGKNITNIIAGWGTFVISLGIQLANDLDIGRLANSFLNLIEAITRFGSKLTDVIIPALQKFYETSGLQQLVQWIGQKLADSMDFTADIFTDWAEWLEENQEQIKIFAEELGKAVKPVAELAMALGDIAWEAIKLAIIAINEGLQGIAESVIQLDSSKLISLFSSLGATLLGIGVALKVVDIGFKQAFGKNTSIKDTVKEIKDVLDGRKIAEVFKDKASMDEIKEYIRQVFQEGLLNGIMTITDAFKNGEVASVLFALLSDKIRNFVVVVKEIATPAIKGLWNILKTNPIARVIALIVALVASVVKAYNEFEVFREYVHDTFNVAKEAFSGIAEAFNEMFDGSIKPVCEAISPAIKSVINVFKTAWTAISTIIGIIVTVIGGTLLSVFVNTFAEIAKGVINAISSVVDILSGLITFVQGVFTGDMDKALKGLLQLFTGLGKSLQNIFRTTFNIIAGFFNGFIRGLTNAINMVIKAINRINIKIPDWVPGIGGKKFGGFNIGTIPARTIPLLANGGVITKPTVAMMGEYAGATQNPEIVAPQSILRETIENSNNNVVNALIQQTRQLLTALENIDMNVSIGDDVIAQSAQRGNQAYQKRTGKPLFA